MGYEIYVRWEGFEDFESDPLAYNRQNAVSHNPPAGLLSYSATMPAVIRKHAQQLQTRDPLGFLLDRFETTLLVSDMEILETIRIERDALLDALAVLEKRFVSDTRAIMDLMLDVISFLNYVMLLVLEGKQDVTIIVSY